MIFMPEFSPPQPSLHAFQWTKTYTASSSSLFWNVSGDRKLTLPPTNCFGKFWLFNWFYLIILNCESPSSNFSTIALVFLGEQNKFKPPCYMPVRCVLEIVMSPNHPLSGLKISSSSNCVINSRIIAPNSLFIWIFTQCPEKNSLEFWS